MLDKDAEKRPNSLYLSTLAKGLQVLRAFDETHVALTLGELVRRTGLEKSAVQRLAHTLEAEGMLVRDAGTKRYRPSHAWLQLAYAYYWSDPLIARALPRLVDLSQTLGETVNLAQISGDHIIYALRLPSQRTHFAASIVGRRLPAISTASGQVMLATWPAEDWAAAVESWSLVQHTAQTEMDRDALRANVEEAARNGYALTQNQMILNEISVAVPIRGIGGRADAAAQVSVSTHSYDVERVKAEILPALVDTANGILA